MGFAELEELHLEHDPIIEFYLKIVGSTEHETKLPIYSETTLRLACKQLLGINKTLDKSELLLYRKLLLFFYALQYKSVGDLLAIMTCFDEDELTQSFDQLNETICQWHKFKRKYLLDDIFKKSFCDILYLWHRRYTQIFGNVSTVMLQTKALEIKAFLEWDFQLAKCLKNLDLKLKNINANVECESKEDLKNIGAKDLDVRKIISDIKPKLNRLVWNYLPETKICSSSLQEAHDTEVPQKKTKVEQIELLNIEILTPPQHHNEKPELKVENLSPLSENDTSVHDDETEASSPVIPDKEDFEDFEQLRDNAGSETDESQALTDAAEVMDSLEEPKQTVNSANKLLTYDTAMKYISALQAYAVNNGHFEALVLLDNVDSIFRKPITTIEDIELAT